jgi:SAM-dependent methyltransferase
LEHIENPANAIREFARVVKPSGQLIISVPNIMNIEERLKWLFSGYTSHFKPLSAQALRDHHHHEMEGLDEIALHVNPIGYAELRYLLEKSGFELVEVFPDKVKSRTWLFAPLTGLITLASRFTSRDKRESRWTDELNSPAVLRGGNTLIFHAKKI